VFIFQDVSLVSSSIQKDASAVESLKVELSQVGYHPCKSHARNCRSIETCIHEKAKSAILRGTVSPKSESVRTAKCDLLMVDFQLRL
jgi:hypothetical protein